MPTSTTPETTVRELHAFSAVTSTAAGLVDSNYTSMQGTTGCRLAATVFSSFAQQWREYRVLSLRVEYEPAYAGCNPVVAAGTNAQVSPIWTVIDRNDASAVATYNNIIDNSSRRSVSLTKKWFRFATMNETGEATFLSVAGDNNQYYTIKFFSSGNSANTVFGQVFVRWIVEFRTRV